MSEPITEEQLNEWEALAEGATPGEWRVSEDIVESCGEMSIDVLDSSRHLADTHFIAAARTAVPVLIAEVRRLRAMESNVVTVQPGHVHLNGQCTTGQCPPGNMYVGGPTPYP